VLGSGAASIEERLEQRVSIPFDELPGVPKPSVAGHRGRFVWGRLAGVEVLVQSGRIHAYEGRPLERVVAPVRVLASLGVRRLVMTQAVGAIRRDLEVGDLVLVDDVLGFAFRSPLAGAARGSEARFPDMSTPFDETMRSVARSVAAGLRGRLEEGCCAWMLGPQYETAAEVRVLERLGADVVGMSTAPELIVARAAGLSCMVVAVVTNRATGLAPGSLSQEEVLAVGAATEERLSEFLAAFLCELPEREGFAQSVEAK
jgi:purine-nucleoside phosphorylase